MNRRFRWLAACLLAPRLLAAAESPALAYRCDEVHGKVTLRHGADQRRMTAADSATAGDEITTGWFASAVISVPDRGSRFALQPLSTVVLGGGEDGVLLRLERGRLRAAFDKLVGRDQRLVATPGALLAVRGTRYGLEVDRWGNAVLAVFEGVVEVRPRAAGQPTLSVSRGELCRIDHDSGAERWPMPSGMTEKGWTQHRHHDPPHASRDGHDGHAGDGGGPHGGHDGGGHGGGGHGSH